MDAMDSHDVLSSEPVSLFVTTESGKHSLFVHKTALTRIPYFKESPWCVGKTAIDMTLPGGIGIEAFKRLLTLLFPFSVSQSFEHYLYGHFT